MMYQKKPIVVEARHFDGTDKSLKELCEWADTYCVVNEEGQFVVNTVEGPLHVSVGDWVIKGIKGEFYPCKPDIFEMTYEWADGMDLNEPT